MAYVRDSRLVLVVPVGVVEHGGPGDVRTGKGDGWTEVRLWRQESDDNQQYDSSERAC